MAFDVQSSLAGRCCLASAKRIFGQQAEEQQARFLPVTLHGANLGEGQAAEVAWVDDLGQVRIDQHLSLRYSSRVASEI